MDKIELKNKKANIARLKDYGFTKNGDKFNIKKPILNGQFELNIEVYESVIKTCLIEITTGDEYTLHLTDATGEFVGRIKQEYKNIISDITNRCFESDVFKSEQSRLLIDYIKKTYGSELEFLWEKFPQDAIVRRKDNKKWFGVFMVIEKNKLGLKSSDLIEVIDLRAEEKVIKSVDQKRIFAGYHMNKNHWITICLDNSLANADLFTLLDSSFNLAQK